MPERPNERVARYIVSQVLDLPVTRYEDGRAPSQVDALIHYDDRATPLEIVGDHDPDFNSQWDAAAKTGHRVSVPGLRTAWSVVLDRRARVRDVRRDLPGLMLGKQDEPERDYSEELERLGVRTLWQVKTQRSGFVNLHVEGWWGFVNNDSLGSYVERILAQHDDVPSKLAAHSSAGGHVFIWTTVATSFGIQSLLEDDEPLDTDDHPTRPAGVTHVWVAGSHNTQGCLAWFPDRGWWRTPWAWPQEPLVLDDD